MLAKYIDSFQLLDNYRMRIEEITEPLITARILSYTAINYCLRVIKPRLSIKNVIAWKLYITNIKNGSSQINITCDKRFWHNKGRITRIHGRIAYKLENA